MYDTDAYSALEASLYEAAFVPENWPRALSHLADMGGAAGAVLFSVARGAGDWTASDSLRSTMEEFVEQGWLERNSRMEKGFRNGLHLYPGFVTETDFYLPGEMKNDPLYNEFFKPRGLGPTAGTIVQLPYGDMLCCSLERHAKSGPITPTELHQLNRARPNLLRASAIAARLGYERVRGALDTLETLGFPAVSVTATGVVTLQNSFARMSEDWSIGARDRLILRSRVGSSMLKRALGELHVATGVKSWPLPEPDGKVRNVLHVLPLRKKAHDVFTNSAAVIVMTSAIRGAGASGILQTLFDLSPAEAALAREVAAGRSLEQISHSTGKTVTTLRNQLASVFDKVGVNRQSELIVLLTNLVLPGQ